MASDHPRIRNSEEAPTRTNRPDRLFRPGVSCVGVIAHFGLRIRLGCVGLMSQASGWLRQRRPSGNGGGGGSGREPVESVRRLRPRSARAWLCANKDTRRHSGMTPA